MAAHPRASAAGARTAGSPQCAASMDQKPGAGENLQRTRRRAHARKKHETVANRRKGNVAATRRSRYRLASAHEMYGPLCAAARCAAFFGPWHACSASPLAYPFTAPHCASSSCAPAQEQRLVTASDSEDNGDNGTSRGAASGSSTSGTLSGAAAPYDRFEHVSLQVPTQRDSLAPDLRACSPTLALRSGDGDAPATGRAGVLRRPVGAAAFARVDSLPSQWLCALPCAPRERSNRRPSHRGGRRACRARSARSGAHAGARRCSSTQVVGSAQPGSLAARMHGTRVSRTAERSGAGRCVYSWPRQYAGHFRVVVAHGQLLRKSHTRERKPEKEFACCTRVESVIILAEWGLGYTG